MSALQYRIIFVWLVFLQAIFVSGQDDPYKIAQYPFVKYDSNEIHLFDCEKEYTRLFNAFNKLIITGEGRINVVQIGDSHIQADYLSGRIRQRLQTFFQGGTGGRGFIFPFTMAKTNNPVNYQIKYKGNWESCRNVEKDKTCNIGLSGITVSTTDSISSVTIKLKNKEWPEYDFNKINIYHKLDSTSFEIDLIYPENSNEKIKDEKNGITSINFAQYTDSVVLSFYNTDSLQQQFELYGFSLETQDPGVIYHAIGINGAETESYLRCNLFEPHLAALKPDWIIVSLGTNEAYPKYFNKDIFYATYNSLLNSITKATPEVPVVLTVPGDSYRFRKYLNEDIQKVEEVIFALAKKHHCAVWDFYNIMGGLNSIYLWHKNNLAANDRLHYTKTGYLFQGDLFFNAFLKKYDEFIDTGKLKGTKQ